MPTAIFRDDIRKLLEDGAQLVDVLPREEYEEEHLPGAISLPLRQIETEDRKVLDPERPVIVYCWDDP